MKRFGEKATREALANGATIRAWDWYTASAGYRVIINDETEGYIVSDLFSKLLHDGTITKTHYAFSYADYAAAQPAQDAETETENENQTDAENAGEGAQTAEEWNTESDRVHAETSAWLRQIGAAADTEKEEDDTMRKNYIATILDTLDGETRTETFRAINDEHARRIAYAKCETYEHVETIEPQEDETTMNENNEIRTALDENTAHCKHIAQDIERIAEGGIYTCPECGEMVTMTETEDADGFTVYELSCGHTVEYEPESVTFYEYFSDVYDIEYRVGSDREYRSVKLMVAFGGPNIYIDTARRAVLLYWWTDRAEYPISNDACDEIDNVFSEIFEM